MADEMMRMAGRGFDKTAKALKTNDLGELVTAKPQKMENIAWTWHTFPVSIHVPNAGKTFVGGVMRGGVNNGHILYTIDSTTHEIVGAQLSTRYAGDDHNMVALLHQPTKSRIVAYYTGHGNGRIYYRYINNYDLNDMSPEYSIENSEKSTYINIHSTVAGKPIYIFSRISDGGLCVFVSQDDGLTWTRRTVLANATNYLDAGKAYATSADMGITLTGHGGTGDGAIYYGYLNIDGELRLPNGDVVANLLTGVNLPLSAPSDLKLVAENAGLKTTVSSTNSSKHRLTFISGKSEENFETFDYKYAQYNSSTDSFDVFDVMVGAKGNLTGGSHAHYVGSCHDVGVSEPIIYCSNYNSDTREWEIWEYAALTTDDVSAGFSKTLLESSDLKLFRPVTALSENGEQKPVQGFWLKGYYSHYRNFYTNAQTSYDFGKM